MSLLNNYDTNYIVFLYDHICQQYFLWDILYMYTGFSGSGSVRLAQKHLMSVYPVQ